MDVVQTLSVGVVFVLAGGVKGITGMGLPTVAVSLLGLWMSPAQAAALLVAPSLATNVAQCQGPHWRRLLALLWPVWLALAIATVFAPEFGAASSSFSGHRLLGLILVVYGAWGLWRPALADLSRHHTAWRGAIIGAATGLVAAVTAVFAFPLVPYLQALRLDKDTMVQALGLSFTVATLALAVRLQTSGAILLSAQSALALGAAFVGMWLGALLRNRISAPAFQRALFMVFIGLGAANLLRGG
jgi:uncharacterized membrane protein YfcA